jgi:hypothetical protein
VTPPHSSRTEDRFTFSFTEPYCTRRTPAQMAAVANVINVAHQESVSLLSQHASRLFRGKVCSVLGESQHHRVKKRGSGKW